MKKFKNPIMSFAYFCYRLVSPVIDPIRLFFGLTGYWWYVRDLCVYVLKDRGAKIPLSNLFPILHEKTATTTFDAQYFHQVVWAFRHILKDRPGTHVDVASKYEFSGYLSTITKSIFVDIRPIETNIPNLQIIEGDILHLPFKTGSQLSVSCLHVIEHIGLGRYGDTIDPKGSDKACKELSRILKTEGKLYISVPIGTERICFNAHRVFDSAAFTKKFPDLVLREFSCIDDDGKLHTKVHPELYRELYYGCGFYLFTKR